MATSAKLTLYIAITSLISNLYALSIEQGYYYIINEVSRRPLACYSSPIKHATLIQNSHHIFKITSTPYNSGGHMHYQVRCMASPHYCWDYRGANRDIGLSACSSSNADQWYKFYPDMSDGDYTYKITGAYAKYLTMSSSSVDGKLQTATTSSSSGQRFTLLPADSGRLHLSDVPLPGVEPLPAVEPLPGVEPSPDDITNRYYGFLAFFSSASNVMISLILLSNIVLIWLSCGRCSKTTAKHQYLAVKSIDTDSEMSVVSS